MEATKSSSRQAKKSDDITLALFFSILYIICILYVYIYDYTHKNIKKNTPSVSTALSLLRHTTVCRHKKK